MTPPSPDSFCLLWTFFRIISLRLVGCVLLQLCSTPPPREWCIRVLQVSRILCLILRRTKVLWWLTMGKWSTSVNDLCPHLFHLCCTRLLQLGRLGPCISDSEHRLPTSHSWDPSRAGLHDGDSSADGIPQYTRWVVFRKWNRKWNWEWKSIAARALTKLCASQDQECQRLALQTLELLAIESPEMICAQVIFNLFLSLKDALKPIA